MAQLSDQVSSFGEEEGMSSDTGYFTVEPPYFVRSTAVALMHFDAAGRAETVGLPLYAPTLLRISFFGGEESGPVLSRITAENEKQLLSLFRLATMLLWIRNALTTALIMLSLSFTSAQTIDTSFNVQDAFCTSEQRVLLDVFVTETLQLVNTALKGIDDYNNDREIQQFLLTYLGTKQSGAGANMKKVRTLLKDVSNFLSGTSWENDDEDSGTPTEIEKEDKPKLFCSSKWWQQKQSGDLVQDAEGNEIPDQTIGQRFRDKLVVKDKKKRLANGQEVIEKKQQYAYWTDIYKAYEFADDEEGEFFCDDEDQLGLTDEEAGIEPTAMTLCPSAFKIQPGNPAVNKERTTALGSARPRENQILNELQPRSLTFFHEVIHVVKGVKATTLVGQNAFEFCKTLHYVSDDQAEHTADGCPDIMTCAKDNKNDARKNPDNYVFFALSYWYWRNRKYSKDDDSGNLAAGLPGVRYNFANCHATEIEVAA
ncbi:MAG: hypothetical protein Q9169_007358 [Polycauliona sp. 2 TL-2023]